VDRIEREVNLPIFTSPRMSAARHIAILLTLVLSSATAAQELRTSFIGEIDFLTNAPRWVRDSIHYELPPLPSTRHHTSMRISLPGQIIDLYSDDNKVFFGSITQSMIEYQEVKAEWGDGKDTEPYRYVYRTEPIDTATATEVARHILHSGQDTLRTDGLIPGWRFGILDGWAMDVEFNICGWYTQQSYYCFGNQPGSIPEKHILVGNYEHLDRALDLTERYQRFTDDLPAGIYSRYGYLKLYKPKGGRKPPADPACPTWKK
jgi:hypothetical protein